MAILKHSANPIERFAVNWLSSMGKESLLSRSGSLFRMAKIRFFILTCAGSLLAPATFSQSFREYDVKAVFLYNFTQFVEWPGKAFPDDSSPIVIGVLGADPFGKSLQETVRNETVRNRKLIIQHYLNVEEIKTCHILFISQSEIKQLDQILASLRGRNILTVGEMAGFSQRGGVISFLTDKNKIRLRVNLAAAREANLTLSSKLLRVAETD